MFKIGFYNQLNLFETTEEAVYGAIAGRYIPVRIQLNSIEVISHNSMCLTMNDIPSFKFELTFCFDFIYGQ